MSDRLRSVVLLSSIATLFYGNVLAFVTSSGMVRALGIFIVASSSFTLVMLYPD